MDKKQEKIWKDERYNPSREEIIDMVRAAITVLYNKNKKLVTTLNRYIEDGDFSGDPDHRKFFSGMYTGIQYYKDKEPLAGIIDKSGFERDILFADEIPHKRKRADEETIWKVGYYIVQIAMANRSTRRLRLFFNLYASSNAVVKPKGWTLVEAEKKFAKLFRKGISKIADKINGTEEETPASSSRVTLRDIAVDINIPQHSYETYLRLSDNNPGNVKELSKVLTVNGYDDDDLEKKNNLVFTKDNSYAVSLVANGNDAYIFLSGKTGHYWKALLLGGKIPFIKYNFTRTFNDNLQALLRFHENIFPIRLK